MCLNKIKIQHSLISIQHSKKPLIFVKRENNAIQTILPRKRS
jgi:hypothetical protein